jgi:hypothetical protein
MASNSPSTSACLQKKEATPVLATAPPYLTHASKIAVAQEEPGEDDRLLFEPRTREERNSTAHPARRSACAVVHEAAVVKESSLWKLRTCGP